MSNVNCSKYIVLRLNANLGVTFPIYTVGQNVDLIHSHFKTDKSYVSYILAGYPMICWPSVLEFW